MPVRGDGDAAADLAGFPAARAGFAAMRAGLALATTTLADWGSAEGRGRDVRAWGWRRRAGAGFVATFFKGTSANSTTAGWRLMPRGSGGETRPARPGGRATALGNAIEADGALPLLSHVRGRGRCLGTPRPIRPARQPGPARLTLLDRGGTTVAGQEPRPSSSSDSFPTTGPSRSTDQLTSFRRQRPAGYSLNSRARARPPAGNAVCAWSRESRRRAMPIGKP